ncbi:hypothetical protein B0T21DRAFT_357705 [Apiosordaria backusii]|uniref:Uncharacterized protein n=1 Tax=Apiosordaria backusii TaxID=314023 RepID=A0AA40ERW9_9PEZI|nr:hypothetical protein B0T21DRAFT_357705 [Apiosordaria backusii]
MFSQPDPVGSKVTITVGLDVPSGLNNTGGDLPDVRLFVGDGSTGEIKIDHKDDNGQQATYALFTANDNAICVASASITWPNGDEYGWVGDWGRECGGSWYYSNVFIQGSDYKPDCLWIDANGDQLQTGFQVHWPEFVQRDDGKPGEKDGLDVGYFCGAGPPFKYYTESEPRAITYWVLSNGKKVKRESTGRPRIHERRQQMAKRQGNETDAAGQEQVRTLAEKLGEMLVMDQGSHGQHSAAKLCSSPTSMGPDFANEAEGLFCRMSDKTLWEFCDGVHITDNCFNVDLQQGKVTRDKKYGKVMLWGGQNNSVEGGRSGYN